MTELNATVISIHAVFGSVVVFHAHTDSGKRVRMVADKNSAIEAGEHRTFIGKWEDYKQAGQQFVVEDSRISDVTDAMVETFLVNQTGIGAATARKLIKRFGTELPALLDNSEVEAISSVAGISEAIALQAIQSWHEQGAKKELIDFIQRPFKDNPSLIQPLTKAVLKAHKFYRHAALEKLKDNPYLLWAFCSWTETDQLAQALGIAKDDRRRMVCAVEESLYQLYNDGHTAPPPLLVNDKLKSVLEGEFRSCLAIYEAARDDGGHTKRFMLREEGGWSLPAAYIMESYVQAELIHRTTDTGEIQLSLIDDADTSGYLLPGNHPLDKEQEQAVAAILKYGVVAVVGAAGTGKTSVLYAANDFLHSTGRQVLQVALSGKAAQRLIQQTGQDAFTIESLLSKVEASPQMLDAYDLPVLFIDEASMVDLPLMYRILKVFDGRTLKVVAIGDRGQLPPIGPGLVFHKIIESPAFHVVELKTNYRALAGSTIPEIAKIIREGGTFRTSKDVIIVKGKNNIADESIAQYLQYLGSGTVQIISATKRVMAHANRRIQANLLETAPVVPSAPEFRIGDKVIYKRNDRHVRLVNGSMGVVVQSNGDRVITDRQTNETVPADIVIEFVNEGRVPLLLSQIKSSHDGEWYLQHSYAITCHQAQGSEFDCVIIALEKSRLLDRSWLYTATTRAKKKVIFVGAQSLIQGAIDSGNCADQRYVGIRFDRASNGA